MTLIAVAIIFLALGPTPAPQAVKLDELRGDAEAGDSRAMWLLARDLSDARSDESMREAFRWQLTAAEAGWAPAMFDVSFHYQMGAGGPRDLAAGRAWRDRGFAALEASEYYSSQSVGCTMAFCEWRTPDGDIFAVSCSQGPGITLVEICDGTDPRELAKTRDFKTWRTVEVVGKAYLFGNADWAVDRDIDAGIRWLTQAGEAGCAGAYMLLGDVFGGNYPAFGRANQEEAIRFYRQAQTDGVSRAELEIAKQHFLRGPPDDVSVGLALLVDLANRGQWEAADYLADIYRRGWIGEPNEAEASAWAARAASLAPDAATAADPHVESC